jgi:hypothetical protein
MVDGRLVAEVVPYGRIDRPYWAAWIGQRRVGNYATDTDAKAALEQRLS